MKKVTFEADCQIYIYSSDKISIASGERSLRISISGEYHTVYLTLEQAKEMSLAVMQNFGFDPAPSILEKAVVKAAVRWRDAWRTELDRPGGSPATQDLVKAVDALPIFQTPKDPVAELRAAWTDWHAGGEGHRTAYQRLERAITALEAKEIK